MNIKDQVTLLRVAFDGYFQQTEAEKRACADAMFSLADEIECYVKDTLPEKDHVYCLSVVSDIKDFLEEAFKDPSSTQKTFDGSVRFGKLLHLAHVKPR